MDLAFDFVFYYPLLMAYVWMIGGIYYFFHWERGKDRMPDCPPDLPDYPMVSILIPCFDEGDNVRETVAWADAQEYPNFEIIAINDGSSDDTGAILEDLRSRVSRLRT